MSLASIGNFGDIANKIKGFSSKDSIFENLGEETGKKYFETIRDSLDGLDIDQATKKLSDLKINPELSVEILEAANNANLLKGSADEVADGIKNIGTQTSAIDKVKAAFSGLFSIISAHPFISGGIAIGAIALAGFTAYKQHIEQAVSDASSAASDYSESSTSIQGQIDKITQLRESLDSGNLTEQEAYQTKSELLSIQEQLVDSYGKQAEGIDLVNGSLETQIDLLGQINEDEANKFLTENKTGIDEATKQMEKDNRRFYLGHVGYGSEESQALLDLINKEYANRGISTRRYGTGTNEFMIEFKGDAINAEEVLNDFAADVRELQTNFGDSNILDNISNEISNSATKASDILEKYQEIYQQAQLAQITTDSTEYTSGEDSKTAGEWFNEYSKAIEEYNAALTEGDTSKIEEAKSNYETINAIMSDLIENTDMSAYASQYDILAESLNGAAIAQEVFNDAIKAASTDGLDSTSKDIKTYTDLLKYGNMTDVEFMAAFETDGAQRGEEAVQNLIDLAIETDLISGRSSEEVQKLIDLLVAAGVLAGNTAKSVSDTAESVATDIEDLIAQEDSTYQAAAAASESANKGDTYDSMYSMLKQAKELYKSGDVGTDDFKSIAAMFSPTGADDVANWEENVGKMSRYFTEDNSGILNFLEDLSEKTNESGEALASFNEQTGEWSYNIDDLEQAAYKMGMGYEPFMAMFGKLEDKGFYNDFFSTPEEGGQQLASLNQELVEAEKELFELENDPNTKNNNTAIEAKKQKIEELKERIDATSDSLTELLTKDPEEELEKRQQNIGLLKEQRKSFNEYGKQEEFQTPEGRATLKSWGEQLVAGANELGYENAGLREVTDKEGNVRLKFFLDTTEYDEKISKIENEKHETEVKAVVDADEINEIDEFITKSDAQKKVVELIGVDEATPVIENWDEMEPVDKETTLTARDQATAVLRMWNVYQVLDKQGVLNGQDFGTWVIETWNSLTPEQKEAVLSADPDEANQALNDVLNLSADLDGQNPSPSISVTGADTAKSQVQSVKNEINSLPTSKTVTLRVNNVRKNTIITERKNAGTGNQFNGTFNSFTYGTLPAHAQGTTNVRNVSIKNDEKALINEVGEEGIVRDGKLLTYNNGYPAIVQLKRGDIVFNHKQIEELRKQGYVTNSHAQIVGGESAFAQGTINAYAGTGSGGGSIALIKPDSSSGKSSGNSSNNGSNNNSNNNRNSKNKDKKDDKKENKFQKKWEKFQNWVDKFFDHIERRLERSSELIDKWTTAAENAVTISAQQTAYNSAINATTDSISLNETASTKYLKQARKIGKRAVKTAKNTKKKSDDGITQSWVNDIIKKLQNGSLDITRYKGKERDVIDDLQEWVDKSEDAKSTIEELKNSFQDLYTEMRNLANTEAEEKVDKLNDELDILGTQLDRLGTAAEQNNNILRQNELSRQTMDAYQSARVTTSRNLGSASQRVRNLGRSDFTNAVNSGQKIAIKDGYSTAWVKAISDYNASLEASTTATTNAKKATAEYYATIQENAEQMFNNIVSEFESAQNRISQKSTEIQAAMDLNEAQGYRNSANYYQAMITAEQENQRSLEEERTRLNNDLNNKLKTGDITYSTLSGSVYQNMVSQINDVTNAINESKQSVQDFKNSIQELEWSNFEKLQERIADITEEADFLINELSRRDLVDEDVAGLTVEGNAAMALYASEYGTMIKQVQQYQDEIDKVRQELSNDPYNETLIDHLQELEEAQQDVISSAGDMKDAMIDLTSQALEAQKTALQDIISDYQDMMDLQNDAYDYQKSISDMVTDINNVQKQLSVYASDDSEEARATIQQLQSDLRDKQESLEDTQRQKLTSDINNMFDDLMDNYSDYVDTIIDNLDDNFDKLIEVVNNGLADSKETILSLADKLGIDVSDELTGILGGNDILGSSGNAVEDVVSLEDMLTEIANAKSSEEVDQIVTRLTSEESNRKYFGDQGAAYLAAQKKKQELEAQQAYEQGQQSQITQSGGGSGGSSANQNNNEKLAEKAAKYIRKNMDPAKKDRKDLSDVNKKIYDMTNGQTLSGNELEGLSKKLGITHNNAKKEGNLFQKLKEIGLFDGGWRIRKNSITHIGTVIGNLDSFAKGTKRVPQDMIAEIGEKGSEIVYRSADGSILTPLGEGDMVFTHEMSKNLWQMALDKPISTYSGIPKISEEAVNNVYGGDTSYGGRTINIDFGNIILNDVQEPEQFLEKIKNLLQNDRTIQNILYDNVDIHLTKNRNSLSINRW